MPCQASNTVVDVPDLPRARTELYVYYHTAQANYSSDNAVVQQVVTAAHGQLRALLPGLQTRLLLQRAWSDTPSAQPNKTGAQVTWMEIFSHPQDLSETMITLILNTMAELPAQRLGPRVMERFVTVA